MAFPLDSTNPIIASRLLYLRFSTVKGTVPVLSERRLRGGPSEILSSSHSAQTNQHIYFSQQL